MLNVPDLIRLLIAVFLLAVAGFFVFGFLMTFQPANPDAVRGRIGYGLGVVASALGAIYLLASGRRA